MSGDWPRRDAMGVGAWSVIALTLSAEIRAY
jgi:hypothetical protein